jgi:FKBP-type peptidyl-prolyl cis-trans isomerase
MDRYTPRIAGIRIAFALVAAVAVAVTACASAPRAVRTASGLRYTVVRQGTGPVARTGQYVLIHETTAFADGRVHFTTRTGGRPLRFLLGGHQVIDGVDEGVRGMRVGERRRLIVPPNLSKRSEYPAGLSPEDTLYYEIELVAIEKQ